MPEKWSVKPSIDNLNSNTELPLGSEESITNDNQPKNDDLYNLMDYNDKVIKTVKLNKFSDI